MRICFVTPYSHKVVGGVATFVREMIRSLEKKEIKCVVMTKNINEGDISLKHIYEISTCDIRFLRGLEFTIKMLIYIIRNRRQINIIHLQTSHHILAPVVLISYLLKIPILTTIHGKMAHGEVFPLKSFSIIGEWIILNLSNKVVYVSEETYKQYDGKNGLVITNGIDIEKFYKNKNIRDNIRRGYDVENSFVILYVGRLVPEKGIYELLEALCKLKNTVPARVSLVNVGVSKGDDMNSYLGMVNKLNLNDNIINVQYQQEITKFYNMGDVFVLPSYSEGLPYALLEAMASEMVVIASDVGGISEVVEHEKNGLQIKPKDTEDIFQKLLWCFNNEEGRKTLGRNARITVESIFNNDTMVKRYIKVYKKLNAGKI